MKIRLVLLVIPSLFFKDFKGVKMDLKDFPETFFSPFCLSFPYSIVREVLY